MTACLLYIRQSAAPCLYQDTEPHLLFARNQELFCLNTIAKTSKKWYNILNMSLYKENNKESR